MSSVDHDDVKNLVHTEDGDEEVKPLFTQFRVLKSITKYFQAETVTLSEEVKFLYVAGRRFPDTSKQLRAEAKIVKNFKNSIVKI